ncbi:MAG TPA: GNAT family N-acetyltransferase [Polyangiaceae bacterium]|nr:GNAT family N-acetyltransferase [Polyangiaceae bacterium]
MTPVSPVETLARKHLRFGWWTLLGFLTLGAVLEAFHGFKIGFYLDVGNEARRLALRLGHAHGTLLALVHVGFGLTLASRFAPSARSAARASPFLVAATVLLPGGFLLGGLFAHDGDPGLGVFLVPFGALALFVAVLEVARGLTSTETKSSAPSSLVFREVAVGSAEYDEGERLRRRVLRDPLGIVPSGSERAEEASLRHLAVFEGERMVGYLMLADQGNGAVRMRQVAIDFDRQRRGIGKALVARSEELARASGYRTMTLHARDTAVPFYEALGYEVFDDPFVEVTIPHRKMRKTLASGSG